MIKRKHDHAVEIDMYKPHRGNESLNRRIDLATRSLAPGIEGALQVACIVGHHEVRAERETVRLGRKFLLAPPARRPGSSVPNLSLQLMGPLVVIQVPQFLASIVRVCIGTQQIVRPQ